MEGKSILQSFGFSVLEEPESIYAFSPVYRINDFIVKRTQSPFDRAQRLIKYTTMLKEKGINVVTPIDLAEENPQSIGENTYVVYPFIEGAKYSAKIEEILSAGRLLGKIHSLSPQENTYDLLHYNVFDFTNDEVLESVGKIEGYTMKHHVSINSVVVKENLLQIVTQQDEIQNCDLPMVTTSHDFKANNLIYTPEPYLIDPDNAMFIPRIFDLALALLLFHNEHETAPDQPFTPEEWKLFMKGYNEFITLTDLELSYWQKALEHVFLDEVMWLMADVEEDWENPAQRRLFEGLVKILLDHHNYAIERG